MKIHIALLSVIAFAASAPAQSTMAPLLTRAWDNHRSGWNQQETVLTQANVKAKGITLHHHHPCLSATRAAWSHSPSSCPASPWPTAPRTTS